MGDELREELQILNGYREELKNALKIERSVSPYRLLTIADHITLCDHLVKSRFEKVLVLSALSDWEKCAKQWIKQKVDQRNSISPEPSKKLEEEMTENDKRFLKSLRIAADYPKTTR